MIRSILPLEDAIIEPCPGSRRGLLMTSLEHDNERPAPCR